MIIHSKTQCNVCTWHEYLLMVKLSFNFNIKSEESHTFWAIRCINFKLLLLTLERSRILLSCLIAVIFLADSILQAAEIPERFEWMPAAQEAWSKRVCWNRDFREDLQFIDQKIKTQTRTCYSGIFFPSSQIKVLVIEDCVHGDRLCKKLMLCVDCSHSTAR